MADWKAVRIFISSTFRDMHAERDYLVRIVFPELRERCARRRLHLVDVDLRWGVTEAEAQHGTTLDICLDEVQRCRPFFVALLGERYGWIPPGASDSITAMEIENGALGNEASRLRALFYLRAEALTRELALADAQAFAAESADHAARLRGLKRRVASTARAREYASLAELGAWVLEDLWELICVEHPQAGAQAPADRGREWQDAFIESRSRLFVGRDVELKALHEHVASERKPILAVTAGPGTGKSALLARFVAQRRQIDPGARVVSHFVGAEPGANSLREVLAALCRVLAPHDDPARLPGSTTELVAVFRDALRAAGEASRTTLVIDALDQLDAADDAHVLGWIPSDVANVSIVVSSLPGATLDSLARRNAVVMELSGLDSTARRDLVRRTLATSRKRLQEDMARDQLGMLVAKREADRPLFIVVACEELRVFGQFEGVTSFIASFPETVNGAFETVFARLERDHGDHVAILALSFLACARTGLSEDDLLVLLRREGEARLPHALWAPFYRSLRAYLRPVGADGTGVIDFFHLQIAEAAGRTYLARADIEQRLHEMLARHFLSQADPHGDGSWRDASPRALSELPYHLWRSGDHRLEEVLHDLGFLEAACAAGFTYALADDAARFGVEGVADFLTRKAHLFRSNPRLVFQEAANDSDPRLSEAAHARWRDGRERRPWLRRLGVPPPQHRPAVTFSGHERVPAWCGFSPDGRRLASIDSEGVLHMWDAANGRELARHPGAGAKGVFSPDGSRLVSWSADNGMRLRLRDGVTGQALCDLERQPPAAEDEPAMRPDARAASVGFSADGRALHARWVSAGRLEMRSWDAADGGLVHSEAGDCPHAPLATSLAATSVAVATDDFELCMWDLATGHETHFRTLLAAKPETVQFSADGSRLVSIGRDGASLWDATTAERLDRKEGVAVAGVSPTRALLALAPQAGDPGEPGRKPVTISTDGRMAALQKFVHAAWVYDVATGRALAGAAHDAPITRVRFSPDGARLLCVDETGNVTIWDWRKGVATGSVASVRRTVADCAWSPDGSSVLVASDYAIFIRILASDALFTLSAAKDAIRCAYCAGNERAMTMHQSGDISLWDVTLGTQLPSYKSLQYEENLLDVSASAERIIAVDKGGKVRLLDGRHVRLVATLEMGDSRARVCRFAKDGTRVAVCGHDGIVGVWNSATAEPVCELQTGMERPCQADFSADGRSLVISSAAGSVEIWDLETARRTHQLRLTDRRPEALFATTGDLVCKGFRISCWNPDSDARTEWMTPGGELVAFEISQDSAFFVVAGEAGQVDFQELDTQSVTASVITGGEVVACRFSPGADRAALSTASSRMSMQLVDTRSGRLLHVQWEGSAQPRIEYSVDGRLLLVQSKGGRVDLLRAADGALIAKFEGMLEGRGNAFSRDGRVVALLGPNDDCVNVYESASGQAITTFPTERLSGLAVSPDGTSILAVGWGSVRLWDLASRTIRHEFALGDRNCMACGFSGDGRTYFVAIHRFGVTLRDTASGRELARRNAAEYAFSMDAAARRVAFFRRRQQVGVLQQGHPIRWAEGHDETIRACTFSADGTRFATSAEDGSVKVWDATRMGEIASESPVGDRPAALEFSADGRFLLARWANGLRLFDARTGSKKPHPDVPEKGYSSHAFHRDKLVLVSESRLVAWDCAGGRAEAIAEGNLAAHGPCAVSPDGRRAVYSSATELRYWTLADAATAPPSEARRIFLCAFSADRRRILSFGEARLHAWDGQTGACVATLSKGDVIWSIAFAPDNRRAVTASEDGTLTIWDLQTHTAASVLRGHTGHVWGCDWSADGRFIVSSASDETIRVWDPVTAQTVRILQGHWGRSCSFSPDSTRILYVGPNARLLLVDAVTGDAVATFHVKVPSWQRAYGFSRDGRFVFAIDEGRELHAWPIGSEDEVEPGDVPMAANPFAACDGIKLWRVMGQNIEARSREGFSCTYAAGTAIAAAGWGDDGDISCLTVEGDLHRLRLELP